MADCKKRKASRDYPAYASVPSEKFQYNGSHTAHQVPYQDTSTSSVPPMREPFHILNSSDGEEEEGPDLSLHHMSVDHGDDHEEETENLRRSISIPKDERPAQPPEERAKFEKLWTANFERSEASVGNTSAFIPPGADGRLNRIQGFSFAREGVTHRLYAVFRLEVECIVNEKQWTIYRRFHDFKQLAHQLKNEGIRVPQVPTKTLRRSLDTTFLQKRQVELDRWLREVLMLVSISNCDKDTLEYSYCTCRNKSSHVCAQAIREFLTREANQPPAFEGVDSNVEERSSLPNIPEGKVSFSSSAHNSSSGIFGSESSSGDKQEDASSMDDLSFSLRQSDLMGDARLQRLSASVPSPTTKEGHLAASVNGGVLSGADSRSVEVQEVEEEPETSSNKRKITLRDFDALRMIGRGSFGKVLLVRKKHSSQLFAVKILSKPIVVKKEQVEHTRTERRVLASVNHPFVVCLHYAFQTKDKLFFVLDYCPGGDLFFHLTRHGSFPEPMAKFYAAEIVLALIHLHEQGIAYRDLKPENIMLDVDGHVKLADFGLAKENLNSEVQGTYTMCGTPEYLPPEILNRGGHGTAVDYWNLGMVLYEMLTGRPPWYTQDREQLFANLRDAPLEFPDDIMSNEAMDFIRGLLTRDPTKRLGAMDAREVTYHPFFADIDWHALYTKQVQPWYKPCQYTDPIDAANFEDEFTQLPPAQIDAAGLRVVSEEERQDPSKAKAGGNWGTEQAEKAHERKGSVALSSSADRNNSLRNLSYTFAGFTYDGSNGSYMSRASFDQPATSMASPSRSTAMSHEI